MTGYLEVSVIHFLDRTWELWLTHILLSSSLFIYTYFYKNKMLTAERSNKKKTTAKLNLTRKKSVVAKEEHKLLSSFYLSCEATLPIFVISLDVHDSIREYLIFCAEVWQNNN